MMAKTIKRCFFWAHLFTGVSAGAVIFCMALSGVLLTYERQIVEFSEMRYTVPVHRTAQRLDTDSVVAIMQTLHPDQPHIYVRWVNRDGAAIAAWAGPFSYLLHPYTGAILREGEGLISEFFRAVTDFHRYVSFTGDYRVVGKNITAYANLVLVFLLISGLYLWLPKRLSKRAVKHHLLLSKHANLHQRRHQWHLVFGIWALPGLLIIALTATIFHFDWANRALYGAFGEAVPPPPLRPTVQHLTPPAIPYESLYAKAREQASAYHYNNWYSIWLEIGAYKDEARFYIDQSIGHRQELAYSLYFDTQTGAVSKVLRKEDWSPGGQAWGTARFLHTGEYFGFIGQTLAGGLSLLACILVYTGIVLAWRRLIAKPKSNKPG